MKLLLLISVLSLLGLVLYTLGLCFDESLYTHRGTYACWACISSTIRNVPEIGHAHDVKFYSSSGDGPKFPEDAVTYLTDSGAETVTRELERYFKNKGPHLNIYVTQGEEKEPSINSRRPFIEAYVRSVGNGHVQVTVREIF